MRMLMYDPSTAKTTSTIEIMAYNTISMKLVHKVTFSKLLYEAVTRE